MEGGVKDLMRYRLEKAGEALAEAGENIDRGHFSTSLNRSYYAIFHAMRAANSLYGFDSQKHSGVIAFFNRTFVKDGRLDGSLSKIIQKAAVCREKSDYQDFFVADKADAERQLEDAKVFVAAVGKLLESIQEE